MLIKPRTHLADVSHSYSVGEHHLHVIPPVRPCDNPTPLPSLLQRLERPVGGQLAGQDRDRQPGGAVGPLPGLEHVRDGSLRGGKNLRQPVLGRHRVVGEGPAGDRALRVPGALPFKPGRTWIVIIGPGSEWAQPAPGEWTVYFGQ